MKNFLKVGGISLLLTFVLPIIAVKTVPADAGMAVCLILFFAINPIAACLIGVFLGKNIKKSWYLVFVLPMLFLLSSVIVFAFDKAFAIYAIAYLVLGIIVMAITTFVKKRN